MNDPLLHVAACFEFPAINGGENSLLSLLQELQAKSVRITAIAPQQGPLTAQLTAAGIPIQAWRTGTSDEVLPSLAARRDDLGHAIQRVAPELVHANSLNMSRLLGPVVAEMGLPSVGHLRDIMKLSHQAVEDLSQHRRLLAVSEATRAHHVSQGVPASRVEVLYNGINLSVFRPRPRRGTLHQELGLPAESRLMGGIGQLGLRKGWEVALQALQPIVRSDPRIHFVLVGEQLSQKAETVRYVEGLTRLAREEPLRGHVHFLGRRTDVPQILNELEVLVHPARQEPLGRVLLEAAASGVAIVATDVGGTREIFPAGTDTASLVPPDEVPAMTEAWQTLLTDESRRAAMAEAARQRIEQHFAVTHTAEGLAQHYRAVAG